MKYLGLKKRRRLSIELGEIVTFATVCKNHPDDVGPGLPSRCRYLETASGGSYYEELGTFMPCQKVNYYIPAYRAEVLRLNSGRHSGRGIQ